MKDEMRVLDDPEQVKVAIDPTRRRILEALRLNDLTVAQMAGILGKDQSTVYRHVEKLLRAGLIEVSGERKEHHIPEKVYSRTARIFFLAPGAGEDMGEDMLARHRTEVTARTVELLESMGYRARDDVQAVAGEMFAQIERATMGRLRTLEQSTRLDFHTLGKLRTAILLLEMESDTELKASIERFRDFFV